jgi:hypothetical protein
MPFKNLISNAKETWRQWKPLMYAREGMDDDYNFTPGRYLGSPRATNTSSKERRRSQVEPEDEKDVK